MGLADYLLVTWRVVPAFGDVEVVNGEFVPKDKVWCRCAILTEGKWGGENTPVTLVPEMPMAIAEHIVGLHNAMLDSTVRSAPTSPPPIPDKVSEGQIITDELLRGAVRAGCNKAERHLTCSWPDCTCKHMPMAIEAAIDYVALQAALAVGDVERPAVAEERKGL